MSTLDWAALLKDAGEITEGGSFAPVPDGDYLLEVIKAETKPTKSGKTMFALRYKIVGGEYNGKLVFDNLVISPESKTALNIVFAKFYALGFNAEYFNQVPAPTNERTEQILMGRQIIATLGTREYNKKVNNEIVRYSRVNADGTPSAAPAESVAAAPAPAPAPAPAAAPAPAPAAAPF